MVLSVDDVSPRVRQAEYAVRGPIPALAATIAEEIKQAQKEGKNLQYAFDELVFCNIGNPQAIGQPPLSYPRLVSALVTAPQLLDNPAVTASLPADVVARARSMVKEMKDTGGYSASAGYAFAQRDVAEFITRRDKELTNGVLASPASIFMTNGASQGATHVMRLLISGPSDGLMTPIPQYPLYTAETVLLNGTVVPYFLDESKGWAITRADLENAFQKAKSKGVKTKAIVVINPGNPTGQVLDLDVIRDIVEWAHSRDILILADEVYQENIYAAGKKFFSFRAVVLSHPNPAVARETQLISIHSSSKGVHGECGRRGGFMELLNIPQQIMSDFLKLPAIAICPSIMGQVMMDLVVKGPQPNGESYQQHQREYNEILASLRRRAEKLPASLNKVPGITCNPIEGAMYAFPRLRLPKKFVAEAAAKGMAADALWCRGLVEQEGIVTIPGSGFGQAPGTLHFRTTILPPEPQMESVARRIDAYQRRIIAKYGPPVESHL